MNSNRRARVAAGATVVGLAALGGVALGTNHGFTAPAPTAATTVAGTGTGRAPIVTGASGSTITAAGGTTVEGHHNNPIVTRTSSTSGTFTDD